MSLFSIQMNRDPKKCRLYPEIAYNQGACNEGLRYMYGAANKHTVKTSTKAALSNAGFRASQSVDWGWGGNNKSCSLSAKSRRFQTIHCRAKYHTEFHADKELWSETRPELSFSEGWLRTMKWAPILAVHSKYHRSYLEGFDGIWQALHHNGSALMNSWLYLNRISIPWR